MNYRIILVGKDRKFVGLL